MIRLTSNCKQSFNMGLLKGLENFRQETAKLQRMAMEGQVHSGAMGMAQERWA